jgi:DNA-binding transcriptional LysR family regulator
VVTFRQLEALLAVADLKSFERAARHLRTSQSAVSRLVAELETGFARPLFNREQRATRLTMEGEEAVALARAILRQRSSLLERISSPNLVMSTLRLGATEGAAITWLPRFVVELRSRHPHMHLDVEIGSSTSLHGRLRDGLLDIAIVSAVVRSTGMARFPVGTAHTGWYCSPRLGLSETLTPGELERQPLLIQGAAGGAGLQLAKWLQERDLRPSNVIHSDSLMALLGMAAASLGLTNLPRAVAQEALARKALREVTLTLGSPSLDYIALVRIDAISAFHRAVVQLACVTCNFDLPFQGTELSPRDTAGGLC